MAITDLSDGSNSRRRLWLGPRILTGMGVRRCRLGALVKYTHVSQKPVEWVRKSQSIPFRNVIKGDLSLNDELRASPFIALCFQEHKFCPDKKSPFRKYKTVNRKLTTTLVGNYSRLIKQPIVYVLICYFMCVHFIYWTEVDYSWSHGLANEVLTVTSCFGANLINSSYWPLSSIREL